MSVGDKALEVLEELDKDANDYILFGKREYISTRCGRAIVRAANREGVYGDFWLLILSGIIQFMPWFGPNHCVTCYYKETEQK